MKTVGLIGGMSWESTAHYYTLLNQEIRERLGGLHSASLLLHSVDFAPIEELQRKGRWSEAGEILAQIAFNLQQSGCDAVALCTNTMHKVAPQICQKISIPFLHIAHITAKALKEQNIDEVLLLGTRFTMTEPFYSQILGEHGIKVQIPQNTTRIDEIIFKELCLGVVEPRSKAFYLESIQDMSQKHPSIGGVILGCTEIGMLINQKDCALPLFDTTVLHVRAIADFVTSNNK
jgi:aspartate racemase